MMGLGLPLPALRIEDQQEPEDGTTPLSSNTVSHAPCS